MLVQIMGCLPREKIWNPTVKGRCINLSAVLIAGAVINIILDFSILVLPIGKIWQLQMSNRSKLGVSAVSLVSLPTCTFNECVLIPRQCVYFKYYPLSEQRQVRLY